MKVFRGTRDISPVEIDHKRVSQGVFGDAAYYATNLSDAVMYSGGGRGDCAIVCHYDLPEEGLLVVEEGEFDIKNFSDAKKERGIKPSLQEKLDYQESILSPINLSKVITQSGYQGVLLKGFVEGGEQVVIPSGAKNNISLNQMDVSLSKRLLGAAKNSDPAKDFIQILQSYGISIKEQEYSLSFSLNPTQIDLLKDLFLFIFKINGKQLYSIDFNKLSIEEYEE